MCACRGPVGTQITQYDTSTSTSTSTGTGTVGMLMCATSSDYFNFELWDLLYVAYCSTGIPGKMLKISHL
jgi:hypothetical protein